MIFADKSPTFVLRDVLRFHNEAIDMFNRDRNFSALSFRTRSDAVIESEGQTVHMHDGSITFVPAGVDYRRVAGHDELIVIHFDYAAAGDRVETFVTENFDDMSRCFLNIYEKWDTEKPDNYMRSLSRVYRLFADIYNEYNKNGADHNDYVDRAKRYIKENCGNAELTVTDIADSLNVSAVYLRRLFARYEGTSPKEYLQKHRIKTACTYLSVGGYSVREIALQSGFRDEKYFSIAFKSVVGVSPSKYIYALYE